MKHTLSYTGIASLVLSTSLFAIERPTPVEAPKESGVEVQAPNKKEAIEMPKAKEAVAPAWLGVAGSPVTETLAAHIGTNEGVGVVLDIVSPEGPAAKAGLKIHDVITKIGDVEVHGMDDLRNAVANKKAGEDVDVDCISGGKTKKIKVTLGERPENLRMIIPGRQNNQRNMGGAFLLEPGKQLPEGMFRGLDDAERLKIERLMQGQMDDLRKQMKLLELDLNNVPQGQPGNVQRFELNLQDLMKNGGNAKFAGSVTMADEKGSVSLKMTDDGKEVEVKDATGKTLFAGPYETDVDKEAVPDDIRERIENLGLENNFNNGRLKLRLNGKDPLADE